ncbi:MAG: hypothetical protein Greene071421_164 [Parcubacteria group bacterium Greene0714_21]|nr:MAG: hypothetical protein Greene041639_188 [Parcubacteria group bacterium Greene0416_39]TSC98567.1 MAG: hypothetical protein Greene101447_69 [Parcubacteria group bacterium Greene1014_47]TSD04328.1 MAG: hypothetical protein Greene071421_164 [Parcubacteria group bacterium Greene0714_21]
MLQVPSGRVFDAYDEQMLRKFVQYGFVRWSEEPITLKSGVQSHVYVFGREDLTDHPDLEWLVGRKIAVLVAENAQERSDLKQQCLIGVPTAGTALAQAGSMVNYIQKRHLGGPSALRVIHRIMREDLKIHGAHPDWVNGKAQPELHTYWTVDNVVTDGGSKLETQNRLQESGYPVEDMPSLVFVDRQQGGIVNMEKAGFRNIVVAYNLLDITFALGKLELWPRDAVQAVGEEIEAHQLIS